MDLGVALSEAQVNALVAHSTAAQRKGKRGKFQAGRVKLQPAADQRFQVFGLPCCKRFFSSIVQTVEGWIAEFVESSVAHVDLVYPLSFSQERTSSAFRSGGNTG